MNNEKNNTEIQSNDVETNNVVDEVVGEMIEEEDEDHDYRSYATTDLMERFKVEQIDTQENTYIHEVWSDTSKLFEILNYDESQKEDVKEMVEKYNDSVIEYLKDTDDNITSDRLIQIRTGIRDIFTPYYYNNYVGSYYNNEERLLNLLIDTTVSSEEGDEEVHSNFGSIFKEFKHTSIKKIQANMVQYIQIVQNMIDRMNISTSELNKMDNQTLQSISMLQTLDVVESSIYNYVYGKSNDTSFINFMKNVLPTLIKDKNDEVVLLDNLKIIKDYYSNIVKLNTNLTIPKSLVRESEATRLKRSNVYKKMNPTEKDIPNDNYRPEEDNKKIILNSIIELMKSITLNDFYKVLVLDDERKNIDEIKKIIFDLDPNYSICKLFVDREKLFYTYISLSLLTCAYANECNIEENLVNTGVYKIK